MYSEKPAHVEPLVRTPPDEPVDRQMGLEPEWGDVLAALGETGDYVVVGVSIGDRCHPSGNCAAFGVNLENPDEPQSLRCGQVCSLGAVGV